MQAPPLPSPAQQNFIGLRYGMFLHFGINTYYDCEWSDGTLDQSKYNPDRLNTDHWCQVARDSGMKFLVLVAKHHDGFCNWPSKFTDYGSYAAAKVDVVGRLAESARSHGLKLGLYYSLWDRRNDRKDSPDGDEAYAGFMLHQLEELATQYGEIVEFWFDGGWAKLLPRQSTLAEMEDTNLLVPQGADEEERFIRAWSDHGRPRWHMDELYTLIKSHQPNCTVLNNTTTRFPGLPLFPVDARCGEKATALERDQKIWINDLGRPVHLPLQIETTMSQKGPPGPFASGSWFWHEWDDSVASVGMVNGWKQKAKVMDAVLLINCGVTNSGLLRPEDQRVLTEAA